MNLNKNIGIKLEGMLKQIIEKGDAEKELQKIGTWSLSGIIIK